MQSDKNLFHVKFNLGFFSCLLTLLTLFSPSARFPFFVRTETTTVKDRKRNFSSHSGINEQILKILQGMLDLKIMMVSPIQLIHISQGGKAERCSHSLANYQRKILKIWQEKSNTNIIC